MDEEKSYTEIKLEIYKALYEKYAKLSKSLIEHNPNYTNMLSREEITQIRTLEKILGITNFPKKR